MNKQKILRKNWLYVLGFVLLSFCFINGFGQTDCKVLKAEISLLYKGECKNGLAHGKGEASGRDNYNGDFRKGLPHGTGIYTWSTGEEYEGGWKKGLRHGNGTYSFISGGKDSLLQGNWMNDEFKGINASGALRVILKRNLTRYSNVRRGDGNQVIVKIAMSGASNSFIDNLMFTANSGTEIRYTNASGYNDVIFPFWGKVTYTTWNKLKTMQYNVVFEFEISQPGLWEITLHH